MSEIPAPKSLPITALAVTLAFACVLWQYLSAAGLPFFSEDYTQLAAAETWTSWTAAFDLSLVPLRPLQHLFTYWELHGAGASPAIARIPGFLFQLGSCLLVLQLARRVGLTPKNAAIAMLLFALFPNFKSLAWTAAIGWPGRQFFMLAALVAYSTYLAKRSWQAGICCLGAYLISLGFHQGAFVLPLFAFLINFAQHKPTQAAGVLDRLKSQVNTPLITMILITVLHMGYLMLIRENRHTDVRGLSSLPPNIVKGSLSLAPEWIRVFIIEGLRAGGVRLYLAGGVFLTGGLIALATFWRGSQLTRCLMLCIAIELFIPIMTVGFVQRYAYFASVLLSLIVARWLQNSAPKWRSVAAIACALLGLNWAIDSHVDMGEYERCGAVTIEIVETISDTFDAKSAAGKLFVVNPPACWGAEEDISMFNWGLAQAVDQHRRQAGLAPLGAGKFALWRTRVRSSNFTNGDVRTVAQAELDAAIDRPKATVLLYSDADQTLRPVTRQTH